jgi:hypothetical protein
MQNSNMPGNCTEIGAATDSGAKNAPPTRERSRTPEPPYCWQNKEPRRIIREKMNGHERTASLLSLYDALTEEASNQQSEVFTAGQPYLGELAGISARTVQRLEPLLVEFGVLEIDRPKLRGHNSYKLLAFGQGDVTLRHNGATLRHGRDKGSCRPVEVTEKEHKKEQRKKRSQEVTSDFIAQQQEHFPHLNVEQEEGKARAWISVNPPRRFTRRFFVGWLNRANPQSAVGKKEEW